MERTAIINELRRFEVAEERYNGRRMDEMDNYRLHLEDAMNVFFDDLSYLVANKDMGIICRYVSLILNSLKSGAQQLENRYQVYCKEHQGEDLRLMNTAIAIQKDFTRQVRHRLEEVLTGENPEERRAVIRRDEMDRVAYDGLLSEYGDLLSIQDLTEIFHVTRQTIYNWETKGKIHRADSHGRRALYLKSDIKAYMIQNNPDLVQVYWERIG